MSAMFVRSTPSMVIGITIISGASLGPAPALAVWTRSEYCPGGMFLIEKLPSAAMEELPAAM